MAGRLEGKVALVTGAATGIGEAIAHKFAYEGARVVVNGLPDDPVDDVVAHMHRHGGKSVACKNDVSTEEGAKRSIGVALDAYGKIDVLVNNAGVFLATAEIDHYPIDLFDRTLRMNVRSTFLMTRFAVPELRKTRGNIVSAGSESGVIGIANNTVYGGTKAWIHSFTRGVAVEQAKYGIRANCVCPGPIDTAWTHRETGPMNQKMEQEQLQATPLGRRGTAEEVANVYAFLASDEASYVTGALWAVDGGITVAKGPVGDEVPEDLRTEPVGRLRHLHHTHEGLARKEIRSEL